ncbi:hypothetical protein Tco_0230361, partial [Tanacetum coccineum]
VKDEAVNEEMYASLEKAVTTATGLEVSHLAKPESRGETSWISLQHNGVYYRDTKRKRK